MLMSAQNFTWVRQAGSATGQDFFTAVASNKQGSALFGGEFTGTISFGSNNYTASGAKDLVLMAYDSTGVALWANAVQFSSTGGNDFMTKAAFDSINNRFYITGVLSGSVSVNAQNGTYPATGGFFLARSTATGTVNFLFPTTVTAASEGTGVVVDNAGNVYACGNFTDSIVLGTTTLYSMGGLDAFVVKLTNLGAVLAVRHIGGSGDQEATGISLSSNEVFVAGNFNRPSYFTLTDSLLPVTSGMADAFLVKYNASTMNFSASLRVASAALGAVDVRSLHVDRNTGRAAITGTYSGTISSGSYSRSSAGNRDMFVSVVRAIPFAVDWAQAYGGVLDETGVEVRIGENLKNVFVYGQYNSVQFAFGTADTLAKTGASDHFLMAWSALGNELGANGGTMVFSTDQMQPFAMDMGGKRMYIGGGFRGRADFGTQGIRQSLTSFDAFGAQLESSRIYCKINPSVALTANLRTSGTQFKLCDHDTAGILAVNHPNYTYVWYDGTTAIPGQTFFNLLVTDTGDYYALITDTAKKCTVSSDTVSVRIDPLPVVALGDTSVCRGAPSFAISNYSPLGGVFVGSGITGNVFNPGILQPDTYKIAYAFAAANTCVGRDTADFIIHPRPKLNYTLVPAFCENAPPTLLNFIQVNRLLRDSFYTSIPGQVINDTLFASALIAGTNNTVRYFVQDSNLCIKDTAFQIYVEPKPAITHVSLNPHCENEGLILLTGGNPTVGQGAFYTGRGVLNSNGLFDTDTAGSGTFDVQYHFVRSVNIGSQILQCADSIPVSVQIDTVPVVSFVFTDTVCKGDGDFAIKGGLPNAGGLAVYSGIGVSSGQFFSPVQAGVGMFIIDFTFTDFNLCSDRAFDTIFVRNLPVVSFGAVGSFCENDPGIILSSGIPMGGIYKFQNITLIGDKFSPAQYNIGSDSLRYLYTDTFGCKNEARSEFTIVRKPSVFFPGVTALNPICANSPEIDLIAFGDTTLTPPPSAGGIFSFSLLDSITSFLPIDFASPDSGIKDTLLHYFYRDGTTGCSDTVSQSLKIYPIPKAAIVSRGYTCADRADTLSATGGSEYLWNTGETTAAKPFQLSAPDTFRVTVSNAFQCSDSAFITVDIRNGQQVYAKRDSITTKKNTEVRFDVMERIFNTDTLAIIGTFNVLVRPLHYLEFSASAGVSSLLNSAIYYRPEDEFRRKDSLVYSICNIECPDLCDTNLVIINVLGDPYDFIPNGFSPNEDGINDTWVIPGIEAFPENQLFVYNSWGDLIFEAQPYLNDWSGQTNKGIGGGKKVGDGTYFFVLITQTGEPIKGTIELKSR
jgi:gliding motility-associated-like protein